MATLEVDRMKLDYRCPLCGSEMSLEMTTLEYALALVPDDEVLRRIDERDWSQVTRLPPLCFHGGVGFGNRWMERVPA